jgi:uncharacterized membrane protein
MPSPTAGNILAMTFSLVFTVLGLFGMIAGAWLLYRKVRLSRVMEQHEFGEAIRRQRVMQKRY